MATKPKKETAKKAAKTSKKTAVKAAPAKKTSIKVTTNGALPEDKSKVIELFAQGKGDTGSPEVQVALLTHKITRLTGHLDENKKDNHSRRGLLKVIAKRRRILNYLQKLDDARYKSLIENLKLKK